MSKFNWTTPVENWTKMPNTLIDALPLMESMGEVMVILYILRHTWGYHRFEDSKLITIEEFEHGRKRADGTRIDSGTGLSRNSIRDGIKRAIDHGLLEVVEDSSDKARIKRYYRLSSDGQDLTPNEDLGGEKLTPSDGQKLTLRRAEVDPRTEKETIERKTTKKLTAGLKPNQPVVSSLIARAEPPAVQNGWVGLADDLPALDSFSVSEEEANSNRDLDIPPIAANGDENRLSAGCPLGAPGDDDADLGIQGLAYAILTDPEVSDTAHDQALHRAKVLRWIEAEDSLWLIRHVAAWWNDYYRRKTVKGIGALVHRIEEHCPPNGWPDSFLASTFYRRHYPLTEQEARSRENRKRYAGFPVMGLSTGSDNQLDPDLVRLLDALPVPIWEEEPPC